MKKIVITFGLISGGISVLMMFAILPLVSRVSYESLTVLGYTAFVASFLMVFFGIRSYRDTVGGGTVVQKPFHPICHDADGGVSSRAADYLDLLVDSEKEDPER
jgi:hypothetical protein